MTADVAIQPPQERLPRRRKRQLRQQASVKRSVGPALYSVMEPGEQILAGTYGRARRWHRGLSLAASAVPLAGWAATAPFLHLFRSFSMGMLIAAGLPTLAHVLLAAMRQRVFLGVTNRQVITVRMQDHRPTAKGALGKRRGTVTFRAPVGLLQARTPLGSARSNSLAYTSPGMKTRWIVTSGIWREDLDEVVAALQASGVPVDGYNARRAIYPH